MSTPMSSPTPEEIRAEMRKIGGLRREPISPQERTKKKQQAYDFDQCQLHGTLQHGGVFDNWCVFTGSDGHVVTFHLPKGWYHFGPDVEPLHTNVRYEYELFSDCTWLDGSVEPDCTWNQRTADDGRTLECEDNYQDPDSHDWGDLVIRLDPGFGTWNITGPSTGYIEIPDVCGGCISDDDCPIGEICVDNACVPGCRTNENCPPGQICVDGQCVPGCRGDHECPPDQRCENGKCVDRCTGKNQVWNGAECVCADGYVECEGECVSQGEPAPPPGLWEDCSDDPCADIDCMPPRECSEGVCVCPEGMVAHGELCIPDDPCLGVLCKPNAACDEDSGNCVCDEGFVENDKGECVRDPSDPSAGCFEEEEDCCSNNPTIQIQAGRGLGGGGSFRLNQSCDKSIQLWVDSGAESDADEECEEDGRSKGCSCSYEISQLMDMIAELQSELELIKDNAENCLTKNDC